MLKHHQVTSTSLAALLLLGVVTQAQAVGMPASIREYACAATLPNGAKRIVFAEAAEREGARRIAERAKLPDGKGLRTQARSIQECIELGKERFIDPGSALLLQDTPR